MLDTGVFTDELEYLVIYALTFCLYLHIVKNVFY